MRVMALIVLLFALVGCVPYSDNPLTDPNTQVMDASIYGSWFWKDEAETVFVHIGLNKDSGLLRLVMLEADNDGKLSLSEFSGHTSLLDGKRYLNVKWVVPANESSGYMFVKYDVNATALEISLMDDDAAGKAIKEGFLRGEAKGGEWVSSVRITESRERLQQVVMEKDKEFFGRKTVLHRLNLHDQNPG